MPQWQTGSIAPTGPQGGDIWFNTTSSQLMGFDGTNWKPLMPAGTSLNASTHLGAVGQGFLYLPMAVGSMGGTPAISGSTNGMAAVVYDNKNNLLWIYNGVAWKSAAFT